MRRYSQASNRSGSRASEVPPGSDQPLLDRVACELGHGGPGGGPVQPHDGRMGELGEGVMIAFPRGSTSPRWSTVASALAARPGWSCSHGMASASGKRFFRGSATPRRGRHRRCNEGSATRTSSPTRPAGPSISSRMTGRERDPSATDQQDSLADVRPHDQPATDAGAAPPVPVPRRPGTAALANSVCRPPVSSIVATVANGSIAAPTATVASPGTRPSAIGCSDGRARSATRRRPPRTTRRP